MFRANTCWNYLEPKSEVGGLLAYIAAFEGPSGFIGDNPGYELCVVSRMCGDGVRVRKGRLAEPNFSPYRTSTEVAHFPALLYSLFWGLGNS